MPSQSISETYAEGQRYFMGEGALNNALSRLVTDLRDHNIDYVVIGALALLAHGYPRFTEDIDLIVSPEGLERFHQELIKIRGLAQAFAEKLNPYVREKYLELLKAVEQGAAILSRSNHDHTR